MSNARATFRLTPLEMSEVRDGRMETRPFDPTHLPFFAEVIVEGATGVVCMKGLARQRWRVMDDDPSNDLVVMGPLPSDGIWIRHWKTPITYLALFSTMIVVTGTCEVVEG